MLAIIKKMINNKQLLLSVTFFTNSYYIVAQHNTSPNIIIILADDLGYGDVGFNGNNFVNTPNIDAMASSGIIFNRFYSSCSVSSPTRAGLLTGMHHTRLGINTANDGFLQQYTTTIAEVAKQKGYTTAHFGKWHLGTLSQTQIDGNRGGRPEFLKDFSPPWLHGFDFCFATESMVPTFNPMSKPKGANKVSLFWEISSREESEAFGTAYWNEKGQQITDSLNGDDSEIIMNRVLPFVQKSAKENKPFLVNLWFHAPHLPFVADSSYCKQYQQLSRINQHYFGSISAMDSQIGRLQKELEKLNIDGNTIVIFCSDNGPQGKTKEHEQSPGLTSGLRGRKGSLFEGGIRVPAFVKWTNQIAPHQSTNYIASTADILPTLMNIWNLDTKNFVLDGKSIFEVSFSPTIKRDDEIFFQFSNKKALIAQKYKIVAENENWQMFDIETDVIEKNNIASENVEEFEKMKAKFYQKSKDFQTYFENNKNKK